MTPDILLVEDTREPLVGGFSDFFITPCIRAALPTGDYSVAGAEHLVAIERKSVIDLVKSVIHQRERFERELSRARGFDYFAVVCECGADDLLAGRWGRFKSKANPVSVWESVAAFTVRYGTPFLFAGDRTTGAHLTESLLLKWVRERYKTRRMIQKAGQVVITNERDTDTKAT
jgi:DNA excision repair protein ERCC-4